MARNITPPGLTGREKELYELFLRAPSIKEISQKSGISARTVRFHVSNILHKHRASSRLELLAWLYNAVRG